MTIHYHGTPITPISALTSLRGRHFCVSYVAPQDVDRCHELGQSVMLDNGAFTRWKSKHRTEWSGYFNWCERWLRHPTTWAVIPDVIDADVKVQDALIRQWPFGHRGAPVWHMNEPIARLLKLCDEWPRVCIGSAQEYSTIMSPEWWVRIEEAFEKMLAGRRFIPNTHMLRGMNCVGRGIPFASVDSSDLARNHHRKQNDLKSMAQRWDGIQCGSLISVAKRNQRLRHKLWREASVL